MKKQAGFTLLEILISLFLSSMVILAAIQCYLAAKKIFMQQEGIIRIYENHIIVQQTLEKNIHQAGSFYCASIQGRPFIANESVQGFILPDQALSIKMPEELKGNPFWPHSTLERMKPDSHVMWLLYGDELKNAKEVGDLRLGVLKVEGQVSWKQGTWLVAADCRQKVLLQLLEEPLYDKKTDDTLLKFNPMNEALFFSCNTKVMILRSKLFFIGHSNRFNQDGQPIWSFYSKDLNAPLEELTEGVEHWHLEPVFAEKESLRVTGIHATIWVDSVDATSADVKMVSKNGRTYQDRLTHFVGEYFWALQSFA